jgi:hypothetical protein
VSQVEIQRSIRNENDGNCNSPTLTVLPKTHKPSSRRVSTADEDAHESRAPATGVAQEASTEDPDARRSAEIKKLKSGVTVLEQQVIQEKERFVHAQAQVNEGKSRNQNRNQAMRTQEELTESSRNYRSMKKQQREMEDEIRRLKDIHCGVEPAPLSPREITANLTDGLSFAPSHPSWQPEPLPHAEAYKPPAHGRPRLLPPRQEYF